MSAVPDSPEVLSALSEVIGCERIKINPAELEYFSQDYFRKGELTLAVVAPRNVDELSRLVATATAKGLAIFPRGGGYSYTDGYNPTQPGITLDLQEMDAILEINEGDMYVTVEPGCTWAKLNDALEPLNLRTPFWGPFSGFNATIGGSISQGSITWGASKYGVSSESVLDLAIVAADGKVVRTGASGQPGHSPFFRNYGPDLTGIFCSDCGALGIKAAITLRLVNRPARTLGLSFGFPSFEAGAEAACRVAREGIVADSFGVSSETAIAAAGKGSLADDLRSLWMVGKSGNGPIDGAVRMTRVAIAGRRFLNAAPFSFHFIIDGANRKMIEGQAQAVRAAIGISGTEIANTMPTMARADPFVPYDMLSFSGQRQLPPSTILPLTQAVPFHRAFKAAVGQREKQMKRHNMNVQPTLSTVGTNGFLYEPLIAWDDKPEEFHRRHTSDKVLEMASGREANMDARELAAEIRQIMIDLAFEHGGIHLQIGKVYPYLRERDENAVAILKDIKRRMDPEGLLNPGALGLSR